MLNNFEKKLFVRVRVISLSTTVSLLNVQNNFNKNASQQSLGYYSQFLLMDKLC